MPSKSMTLRPTTSAQTTRYDKTSKVAPRHQMLIPGLYSYGREPEPLYLPPFWSAHIHPEGNLYFVRDTVPKVVTELYLYISENQKKITQWIDVALDLLRDKRVVLPDSVELFLEPEDCSDSCLYYLVDHATRIQFWLEPVSTDCIGLQPAVSDAHLKSALEELYWNHIEQFPCHKAPQLNLLVNELIDVLIHARADQVSSETSTYPFTTEECTQYLDLLRISREMGRVDSAHSKWTIARIWNMISNHRFMTHYGQENCRLSRDQSIMNLPEVTAGWAYTLCCPAFFGMPELYTKQLEDLWVDEVVYIKHWRPFLKNCHNDWISSVVLAFAVLICNLLYLMVPLGSRLVSSASITLCNMSILSGVALVVRHNKISLHTAPQAADYLTAANKGPSGFHSTAIMFSLPRGFALWALGMFTVQGLVWCVDATNYCWVFILVLALVVICVAPRMVSSVRRTWEALPSPSLLKLQGFRLRSEISSDAVNALACEA